MINRIADQLFNSPNILTLDIGTRYMKVMQFDQGGGLPTLHGAAIGSVPPGSIENGIISNKPAVASALSKILDKEGIRGNRVYLAAGGPSLVLRWIEMPVMPEDDLREALKFEARKYLPFPVDSCVLDFKILHRKARQSEETLRLLLIAAPRFLVDSRFETAELAGLKPIGMDVEPLAVLRALEHNRTGTELAWGEHPQAILIFGSAGTDFYVIKDADLEFARRIPIGGGSLSRIITDGKEPNITEDDEYELLRRITFDQDGQIMAEGVSSETASALKSEMTCLDQEIQRSCSYYQSLFPEGSYEGVLTHVAIGGGLAAIPNFNTHLARELDLSVDIADPLARINVRNLPANSELLNGRRTSFIVSAGLFLGQIGV